MGYHILLAPIKQRIVPTNKLFTPAKEIYVYADDPVIKEFNSAAEAFDFVQGYIPFDEFICIPGDGNGLEMYAQMWAQKDEEVLENLSNLNLKLRDIKNYNFEYSKEEYDELIEAIDEHDRVIKPEDRIQDGKYVVDGYCFERSTLLNKELPLSMTWHSNFPDFKDLDLEDQKKCIISNKNHVWVNEGFLFDLYCKKQSKYPWLYAWYLYLTCEFHSCISRNIYKASQLIDDVITTFNAFRIKHNMYEL